MSSFLFINQYYWPDEAATAQLLTDLAEDLVRAGHQATILCGRGRYCYKEKLKSGVFYQNGVRIERIANSDFGRHQLKGRVADITSFMLAAFFRSRRISRHDAVIAMTSPPLVARLGVNICKKHGVPLILWVQDIYPEIAEKLGVLKNPILYHQFQKMALQIYAFSSKVVVLGEEMQRRLESCQEASGKLCTIPNWVDLKQIQSSPVSENCFRKEQGWEKEHVLMYAGNLGAAHEIEAMLILASLLQPEVPSLHFVVVGDTPRHKDFVQRAKEMGIQRITPLPFQKREQLGLVLGAADAHLVSQKTEVDGLLVPSKFYGVVAAGRPVIFIGSRESEIGQAIMKARLGAVIAPSEVKNSVQSAKKVLLMAKNEPHLVPSIRQWAEKNAARSIRTGQFQKLLEEIILC